MIRRGPVLAAAAFLALPGCQQQADAAERLIAAPAATRTADDPPGLKYAIFAGGCFWGIEGVFSHVNGVTSVVSGYHGGAGADANYQRVSSGETRHAEAVRVTYDPAKVRYDQLVQIFFSVIDPVQRGGQGPDRGPQYRTALVPLSAEQRAVASAYLGQLGAARLWRAPVATRIEAAVRFYPAEDHHQDFMFFNPNDRYILVNDAPKVGMLRRHFPALYRRTFTRN